MSTIKTQNVSGAQRGSMGQKYLVAGTDLAMRMWHEESAGESGEPHRRDYETIGYVVAGRVELVVDGESVELGAGDSWHVPKGAERSYRILETLTAVEATAPAAREAGDD